MKRTKKKKITKVKKRRKRVNRKSEKGQIKLPGRFSVVCRLFLATASRLLITFIRSLPHTHGFPRRPVGSTFTTPRIVNLPNKMVVHSQGESQPPIATIVSYALSSFEELLSALDDTLAERAAAVSHLARFKLWAGSLGAHRPSGSRSLAYRLRDASTIKNHVVSLLQGLFESVDEGKPRWNHEIST